MVLSYIKSTTEARKRISKEKTLRGKSENLAGLDILLGKARTSGKPESRDTSEVSGEGDHGWKGLELGKSARL